MDSRGLLGLAFSHFFNPQQPGTIIKNVNIPQSSETSCGSLGLQSQALKGAKIAILGAQRP